MISCLWFSIGMSDYHDSNPVEDVNEYDFEYDSNPGYYVNENDFEHDNLFYEARFEASPFGQLELDDDFQHMIGWFYHVQCQGIAISNVTYDEANKLVNCKLNPDCRDVTVFISTYGISIRDELKCTYRIYSVNGYDDNTYELERALSFNE